MTQYITAAVIITVVVDDVVHDVRDKSPRRRPVTMATNDVIRTSSRSNVENYAISGEPAAISSLSGRPAFS